MNINATLLVQAVNFFIAYLLFRFILLRPAYTLIRQEEHDQNALEGRIVSEKEMLVHMHKDRIAQWRACQQACEPQVPGMPIRAKIFRGIVPIVAIPMVSKQERRNLVDRISHTITSHLERI